MHEKSTLIQIVLVSVLLIIVQQSTAQSTDSLMFKEGVNLYKHEKYSLAQKSFLKILKEYPNTRFLTATKLMLAKSYYKLDDFRAARIVCDNFIDHHPNSSYLDDIHFAKGKALYRQQNYVEAVNEWIWVTKHEGDSRLKQKAGNYVFETLIRHVSDKDIDRLKRKHPDDIFSGMIQIIEAQKLFRSGRDAEARDLLNSFINKYPYHVYADIARQLLEGKAEGTVVGNSFLLLKSSQEGMQPVSHAIAQGVFYAAYEMSTRDPQKTIEIDTLSIKPNVLATLKTVMTELQNKEPLAVIGPLEKDSNSALALLSRYEYFPMIAPTSSQTGLASLSPYTFQINPDAEIKGKFLANYALEKFDFETFAILAPADEYGETIANSFQETIEANGGELVDKQWYYQDTEDFSRQFKSIRKTGFYITFRDSVLMEDSTLAEEIIKEQFDQYMTETLFSSENQREIDSTQVPSEGIDALFIATYPEHIQYIAPQFAFHNIQCTLLGNEGWNDPEQLSQHQVYLNGLIYATAGYYDSESFEYKTFTSRFRQEMHTTPGMYHLLGYDTGKWMLTHYEQGMTRRKFRDQLENGGNYNGILEDIKFSEKPRVNSELNVIKFYMGELLKMDTD